jgi:hypothetical protein
VYKVIDMHPIHNGSTPNPELENIVIDVLHNSGEVSLLFLTVDCSRANHRGTEDTFLATSYYSAVVLQNEQLSFGFCPAVLIAMFRRIS